ncbi:MAG: helix-turn-helix transcriptional regulator [Rikenellaceae bacterium]
MGRPQLRIKELCKKQGITQAEVAQKIGTSASSFAQIVKGNISIDMLQKIAVALDVRISDLIVEERSSTSLTCPNCGVTLELKVKE